MDATAWIDDVEARAAHRAAGGPARAPRALTVLYDPACALCRRCRAWMERQASYVPLAFVGCTEGEARARFGDIPWLGDELVVVGDRGEVWVGPAAFLTCLWALVDWRPWSYRMAGPLFAPLAERFFHALSSRRRALARLVDHDCENGACRLSRHD
jgi:predicted DCC family thiol-disulfide oxidoreductase YuxK